MSKTRFVSRKLAANLALFAALAVVSLSPGLSHASPPVISTGPAVTKTEILAGKNVAPMLSVQSAYQLRAAEERYGEIVAQGGWPKVLKAGLKKGMQNDAIQVLNQRLFIEGYLRIEATQGQYAPVFTTATQDAVARFQRNHGIAITGSVDPATLAELNVPASERLRTIRENIPRLEIYETNLGNRYLVVNVPAQQIEAVTGGRVYSRHNAIVGRPERPTPVVMTALSDVKFNPYWNAPASIVERDIIPKLQSGTRVLDDMNIKVFQGVNGPEIDPSTVNWSRAIADDYHFRQEPGPENAMATAKIEFLSPFGIYLHDTPERQLFKTANRFYSSGCVRVERVDVLLNWILNGQDGYNDAKIAAMAETLEQTEVKLVSPPQLRVVYLTSWPVGDNTVAFRKDVYDLDGTEFTVGQPMPLGETSPEGLRYTLKPIPRLVAQVDSGSESGGLFSGFFSRSKSPATGFRKANVTANQPGRSSGLLINDAYDNQDTNVLAKPSDAKAKKKSFSGLFDWETYRKDQGKKAPAAPVKTTAVKPAKGAKAGTVASATAPANATVKSKTKLAAKAAPASDPAAKSAPAKQLAAKPVKPAESTAKAANAKPACKPDATGKLPANCPAPGALKTPAKSVTKANVKDEAATAAN